MGANVSGRASWYEDYEGTSPGAKLSVEVAAFGRTIPVASDREAGNRREELMHKLRAGAITQTRYETLWGEWHEW